VPLGQRSLALALGLVLSDPALAAAPPSPTAPQVVIEARVHEDLATVSGTLRWTGEGDPTFVDTLTTLPLPSDEIRRSRTFPGAVDVGELQFTENDDHSVTFTGRLPRRWGDVGATPRGWFGNGAWYPTPLIDGALPTVTWDVTLTVPPGTVGVVGGHIAHGVVRWCGTGERASAAVIPEARVASLNGPHHDVALVTVGAPRPGLRKDLQRNLAMVAHEKQRIDGVIVEAPLRRRLAKDGLELAYVSDRAFRLSPPLLRRVHDIPVTRDVLPSFIHRADPWERELAAAAVSLRHAARAKAEGGQWLARFTAWLPGNDPAIYERSQPFARELTGEVHPVDPVRDDLTERFGPTGDATAAVAQLSDIYGESALIALGDAMIGGRPLDAAATEADVWPEDVARMRAPAPLQDLRLDPERRAGYVTVVRSTTPDAPPAAVEIRTGESTRLLYFDAGPGERAAPLPRPGAPIVLDPDRHTAQTGRLGDVRPFDTRVSLSGSLSSLGFTPFFVSGYVAAVVRRRHDTHQQWTGYLSTNAENRLAASVGYVRYLGPLVTTSTRAHRLSIQANAAWLNDAYAPIDGGQWAIGGAVGWRYDNRLDPYWPTRGQRFAATVSGGVLPESGRFWVGGSASAVALGSWHPRHVVATRAWFAWSDTEIAHRRVSFGGLDGLRSLPVNLDPAVVAAVGASEYRWAPARGASIPQVVGWISDVHLTAGLEVGGGLGINGWEGALGATAGASVTADVLGVQPIMIGVTAAWLVVPLNLDLAPSASPRVYLRFEQAF
jgi:hypothetical protein